VLTVPSEHSHSPVDQYRQVVVSAHPLPLTRSAHGIPGVGLFIRLRQRGGFAVWGVAIGHGKSNADIARELYMSIPTVKTHVSGALEKLELNNRVQIALLAHDAGEA
jgi:hypothetical protein